MPKTAKPKPTKGAQPLELADPKAARLVAKAASSPPPALVPIVAPPLPKANTYTPEDRGRIIAGVLRRMEEGSSAFAACKGEGVPFVTFSAWIGSAGELADAYARAREGQIRRLAEEIEELADEPVPMTDRGSLDAAAVQKQRLQIDTRKWLLSKLAPKSYGDRVEIVGDAAQPIAVSVDLSGLSDAELLRLAKGST
jgi:hypothetical protein